MNSRVKKERNGKKLENRLHTSVFIDEKNYSLQLN